MKEPLSNIGGVCNKHSPKPNPEYYCNKPIDWFIGKHVKMGFPTKNEKHPVEHMWVLVTDKLDSDDCELQGVLDNDPVLTDQYAAGDGVGFSRKEVEDHDPKEGTFTVHKGKRQVGKGEFKGEQAKFTRPISGVLPYPFITVILGYLHGRVRLDEGNQIGIAHDKEQYVIKVHLT